MVGIDLGDHLAEGLTERKKCQMYDAYDSNPLTRTGLVRIPKGDC